MSRALNYLLKTRPEPMQAYFSFLKQAGQHLDPKTAALISVITKVHAKTANGLRQYLPKALQAGASADEIIDALLMAMPALGFSKIVWAIDVILEMQLPQFERLAQATPQAETWLDLGPENQFADATTRYARSGNQSFIVTRQKDGLRVYSARCPHKGNMIPESGIHGSSAVCPFHEWQFDLNTGGCTSGGKGNLNPCEVKIDRGNLHVKT